jgi:Reverse transcriptase (RNA-dependent DNA polymerase)/Endonuclease-reverse transcriptase
MGSEYWYVGGTVEATVMLEERFVNHVCGAIASCLMYFHQLIINYLFNKMKSKNNERDSNTVVNPIPNHHFQTHFINIRGLHTNINAVHQHLETSRPHILLLTETQISNSHDTTHLLCPGYQLQHNFRYKGGVCAFIRSDVPCRRVTEWENPSFDLMWFRISLPHCIKFVCCLYRSPNDPNYSQLFDFLSLRVDDIECDFPSAEIVVLGDFNVHNVDWLPYSTHTDSEGREAEFFAISCNLSQLVDTPTRIPDISTHKAYILDLYLTNKPFNYNICVVAPLGSSDHSLIMASSPYAASSTYFVRQRRMWHYNSAQWDDLRNFYSVFPWSDVCFSSTNPTTCAQEVTDILLAGMEAFIPYSDVSNKAGNNPWFNKTCSQAVELKNKAFHKWKTTLSSESRSAFVDARNKCKAIINQAKADFDKMKCEQLISCPTGGRSFWSLAKAVGRNFCTSSIPPLICPDGSVVSTPKQKADLLASIFSENSTLDDNAKCPPVISATSHAMPMVVFRHRTVRRILQSLETNKASGPDGIPPIVLKKCAAELTPVLCRLFQLSFSAGIFPACWKLAHVQPIPKKGDSSCPSNYRPIALISVLSKVMEKVINVQLLSYLESAKLISDHQYGFRKNRSTGDVLAYVTHVWNSAMERFGEAQVVALDISKAFDKVWHRALLSKLRSYGINSSLCQWFSSFLSGRSIRVVVDGSCSDAFPVNAGVPQGSVLSPTLFLLHINDLLSITANSVHSFADDSTLHASYALDQGSSSSQHQELRFNVTSSLNSDINAICQWGIDNLVEFNSCKTQSFFVSRKKDQNFPPVFMSNNPLTRNNSLSVLGLDISSNLSWHSHVVSIAKSASKKLGFLFRARRYFSSEQLLTLYKSQVRPTLEYCSHIWGGAPKSTLRLLDIVQKRAIRLINNPNLTDSLQSLTHRRAVAALCIFYRYYHGRCSEELAALVPPPAVFHRTTRNTIIKHPYCVQLAKCRTDCFSNSFIPTTSRLWNSLPGKIFPEHYNLQLFKLRTHKFLLNCTSH